MKINYIFALLATTCLLFASSCKDDESPSSPLVGTWAFTSESNTGCDDPDDNYVENYTCTADECQTATFNSDGTFTLTQKSGGVSLSVTGTYVVSGNNVTVCTTFPGNDEECDTTAFTINGNTLTTSEDDDGGCTYNTVLTKQ